MTVHLGLCVLVLVNLLFVQITGVVGQAWILTFTGLTLAAPLLRRFTDRVAYRLAWNGVVLLLFASLVQRTLQQGVARMLESGLVLAVFCQVHLVNNVSARQRPDLLLFNSFLIAVITAFFCQELSYCAVFVGYVFVLLMVWRLLAHRDGHGNAPLGLVLRDGARQAALVLGATAVAFLFWPRNFEREGLVGERFLQAAQAHVGLADEIRLTHSLTPVLSDRVVMKIHGRGEIPTHWRGTTFRLLQQGAWRATATAQDGDDAGRMFGDRSLDVPWREQAHGHWARAGHRDTQALRVDILDPNVNRLLLPLEATSLRLSPAAANVPHFPFTDGTFGYFVESADDNVAVTYEVECAGNAPAKPRQRRLDAWLGLEPATVPGEAFALGQEVRAKLPANATPAQVAEALCARLRDDFAYGLPGHTGSAGDLQEFFTLRRGHCEFFASALAMMLRSQRIACRLVGGFLASERADDETVVVRARHAHAWVEVWDGERRWLTFDATPAQSDVRGDESWFDRLLTSAESAWTAVTGFDERRRTAVLQWVAALPRRAIDGAATHPFAASALVVLIAWLWHRRRTRGDPVVVGYERVVRQARLRRSPGETPRQLLARARAAVLPAPLLGELVAATERHERVRYRGQVERSQG